MLKFKNLLIAAVIVMLGAAIINSRKTRKDDGDYKYINPALGNPLYNNDDTNTSKSNLQIGSTTYTNNLGTNIMGGKVGSFRKSSFSWTITKNNDKFNIKSNAMSGSFNVVYSHYDSPNKLYHYDVSGSGIFDNAIVKVVMTNGKLDQYAVGDLSRGNLLTILFTDNNGYLYKLGK